jgi:hypothetical protein
MHAAMHVGLHVSVRYCCEILTRTGRYEQILVKLNTKFNENPFSNCYIWTDVAKPMHTFYLKILKEAMNRVS